MRLSQKLYWIFHYLNVMACIGVFLPHTYWNRTLRRCTDMLILTAEQGMWLSVRVAFAYMHYNLQIKFGIFNLKVTKA